MTASLCMPGTGWAAASRKAAAPTRKLLTLQATGAESAGFLAGVHAVSGTKATQHLDLGQLLRTGLSGFASHLSSLRGSLVLGLLRPHHYALLQEALREVGGGVWAEGYHGGDQRRPHRFSSLPRSEGAADALSDLLRDASSHRAWPAVTGALMAQIAAGPADSGAHHRIARAMPVLIAAARSPDVIDAIQVSFVAEL